MQDKYSTRGTHQHSTRAGSEKPNEIAFTNSASLQRESPLLLLVSRGASVVLVTPDPVPDTRHERREDKHNRRVVDSGGENRDGRGHAEERHGKGGPG